MSVTTCKDCRHGKPCDPHTAANDAAAILATVTRQARPYNAGGVGFHNLNLTTTPAPPAEAHRGLTGRLAALLHRGGTA